MSNETLTLDVCDDIRNGREPFSRIMKAVREISSGQKLLLIAPFKPVPLFGVMRKQGFAHDARKIGTGHWEVLFTRVSEKSDGKDDEPGRAEDERRRAHTSFEKINAREQNADSKETKFIEVDARGLEPPQPMVKILEALAVLPDGAGLRAHTDRRPVHLYAQLEARGFVGDSTEQNDGSFITQIQRS